ncbi:MAG: ATP-dependent Clp protease adapter ClpS [Roseovarius sp.]|nr:ATP-dependent Clp protease adapter ClpS [Roseovarius sp.]MCY4207114.1 ATP-dependent Clp protease adapter ClpS [Roseovarius sp.]MCY4316927.1 ATP-dependent Clp protease adapter ClpS [Roseovarius sp.]
MQHEPRISVSGSDSENSGLIVASKPKPKTKKPPLYKVLLLNDDYTPMEFVVEILMSVFKMPESAAYQTMMAVHNKGLAVVGIYSHQIAETKVAQVMSYAKMHQHPLQCTMEKE